MERLKKLIEICKPMGIKLDGYNEKYQTITFQYYAHCRKFLNPLITKGYHQFSFNMNTGVLEFSQWEESGHNGSEFDSETRIIELTEDELKLLMHSFSFNLENKYKEHLKEKIINELVDARYDEIMQDIYNEK